MAAKRKQQYRHLPAFILLSLAEQPLHGSAIHGVLVGKMGLKPDSGAVYRTLQQLEQDGEVVSQWDTSGSGPARKIFTLTPAGWDKLDEWRQDVEMRLAHLQYFLDMHRSLKRPGPGAP